VSIWKGPGAILCYHGVIDGPAPGVASFHVSAAQLAEGIAQVQSVGRVVHLAELLRRIEAGKSTSGLFALTFDDAYEGVLRHALPVLRTAGAPAAVFPVSSTFRGEARFWWDRLEGTLARAQEPEWQALTQGFEVAVARGPAAMTAFRDAVLVRMQGRLTVRAEEALQAAERATGFETALRAMSADDLTELARDPLISIGPHTETHATLACLDNVAVEREITRCTAALAELGLTPLPVLAVPYGAGDNRTVALARRAGMMWCLGTAARTLAHASPTRPIPRFVMSTRRRGWRLASQLRGFTDRAKAAMGGTEPDWPLLQGLSEA
jgi:peptidoglycan/xylan/chitin deacetylase (PgdA/CDA1 family)